MNDVVTDRTVEEVKEAAYNGPEEQSVEEYLDA